MEKRIKNSGGRKRIAILGGIVDALLLILLILVCFLDPVRKDSVKANLPEDFIENAETNSQIDTSVEYTSSLEIKYAKENTKTQN